MNRKDTLRELLNPTKDAAPTTELSNAPKEILQSERTGSGAVRVMGLSLQKLYKRRGAVPLSSRLSTRFIGSFADKLTESGDSTIVWGRSPASPKRPPCKRRGHYG